MRRGTEGRAPIIHISVLVTSNSGFTESRGRVQCSLNLASTRLSNDEAKFRRICPGGGGWTVRWIKRSSNLGEQPPKVTGRINIYTDRKWGTGGRREIENPRDSLLAVAHVVGLALAPLVPRASFPLCLRGSLSSISVICLGQATFFPRHKGKEGLRTGTSKWVPRLPSQTRACYVITGRLLSKG